MKIQILTSYSTVVTIISPNLNLRKLCMLLTLCVRVCVCVRVV
jgi:hypothetical protein